MELYPHQLEALKKMHNGCILCAGVGTGKSMTSLAYFMLNVSGGKYSKEGVYTPPKYVRQLIIITTAKKRDSKEWERELNRWDLSTDIFSSEFKMGVIVDSWNNIKKYTNRYGSFFIFDEQRVTGYGAWVKSFLQITRKNQWILLSATPGDVWMDYLPVFIANGFYRYKKDFMLQHVMLAPYITKFPKIIGYINIDILEKHRNEVLVLMKYDKPVLTHHEDVFVGYDPEKYDIAWKKRFNPYKNRPIKQVSELFSTMRKIVNTDKSRIDAVKEICERKPRVIVFYNFNYELLLLREMCEEIGRTYSEWNGHKHDQIPVEDRWVYLVQYNAGAEGWECIDTNIVVFYSQTYSYRATTQAAGRIDRLNTPFTDLYFYHVKSLAPIDRGITKALNRKENFNENAYLQEEEENAQKII